MGSGNMKRTKNKNRKRSLIRAILSAMVDTGAVLSRMAEAGCDPLPSECFISPWEKRFNESQRKLDSGEYRERPDCVTGNDGIIPLWRIPKSERVRCGAKTRKGTPCRCLPVMNRKRCIYHGGCSTGPRTAEGRARIAESNRRRASLKRAINLTKVNEADLSPHASSKT